MESDQAPLVGIIQVNFVGNYLITWEPSVEPQPSGSQLSDLPSEIFDSQPSVSDAGFPSTNAELKRQFVSYIQRLIRRANGDSDSDADFCDPDIDQRGQLKSYYSLLAIVHDPTSALVATDITRFRAHMEAENIKLVETAFRRLCTGYLLTIDSLGKLWNEKNKRDAAHAEGGNKDDDDVGQNSEKESSGPAKRRKLVITGSSRGKADRIAQKSRGKADRDAQNLVPGWYHNMCVLTGGTFPLEAAHIIDFRVVKKLGADGDAIDIWDMLSHFWPIEDLESLMVAGNEKRNILPLRIDAHKFWDGHRFALRPLEQPTDPAHRLYLQVVWLKDINKDGNLVHSPWDHRKNGTITDFRRGSNDDHVFPAIQHGDVYELVTADEVTCPLPSMQFLRLRYAVQKLLAGMMAAGALKDIFRGPPPSAEGPVRDEAYMPGDWDMLIRSAQEEGLLSVEAAKRWRRHVLETAYQDYQARVEQDAEWRAEREILCRGEKVEDNGQGS